MVKIVISKSSHDAIAAWAIGRFVSTARVRPDGMYVISIDDEVAARLEAVYSDPDQAIRILCSTGVGHA